ncbi:hypothetical protein Glove_219g20 [Diversispora epigaea]|uniref:Uncharacterized protein n=1 Tax=Diversispora epigaea TaxID=1348612 RepID=A0A397IG62_9GLOM|nr:hypothetical protein Glove_219g20 [Diversispora epigaea]
MALPPTDNNEENTTSHETFYFVKLRDYFKEWERLWSFSDTNIIIVTILSLLSLIVGVFLFISHQQGDESKIKEIFSSAFSGIISTTGILGGLSSIKDVVFKSRLETFDGLYKEEADLKIKRTKAWTLHEIDPEHSDYDEKHRKELYFMKKLVEHVRIMLIFRSIWAIVFSLSLAVLSTIAIYSLIGEFDIHIFLIIDVILIAYSTSLVSASLYILFLTKLIIPRFVNTLMVKSKNNKSKEGKNKEEDKSKGTNNLITSEEGKEGNNNSKEHNDFLFSDKIKVSKFITQETKWFDLTLMLIYGIPILYLSLFLGLIIRKDKIDNEGNEGNEGKKPKKLSFTIPWPFPIIFWVPTLFLYIIKNLVNNYYEDKEKGNDTDKEKGSYEEKDRDNVLKASAIEITDELRLRRVMMSEFEMRAIIKLLYGSEHGKEVTVGVNKAPKESDVLDDNSS